MLFKPMPLNNYFRDYNQYWLNRHLKNKDFVFQKDQAHKNTLARAKIISNNIKANAKILDIGCGDGTMMNFLSKNKNPLEIVGIDISEEAVKRVQEKGYKAYQIDIASEEFSKFLNNKEFDYLILSEVLEHIQEAEKVMMVIKGHVAKAIFISLPNAGYYIHRLRLLLGRFPVVAIVQHIKEHVRFWTLRDFVYWCDFLGYRVEDHFVFNDFHFKPLKFLNRMCPSLFADQLLYRVVFKNYSNTKDVSN